MDFKFDNQIFTLVNYGSSKDLYFKAHDIAKFLGYSDTDQAIRTHVWTCNKFTTDDLKKCPVNLTGSKNAIYINEAGLYQLIFRSKMPYAETFQKWVIEDVLPSIRRTGQYKNNKQVKDNKTFKIENEYDLHTNIINFIRTQYPEAILTVCNPELSNDTFEKRSKCYALGYSAGTFDVILMNMHVNFSGLCIEFKSPSGKGIVSEQQQIMCDKYKLNNYKTLISNDYNECIMQIIEYMRNTRIKCPNCSRKFKTSNSLNNHLTSFHRIKQPSH